MKKIVAFFIIFSGVSCSKLSSFEVITHNDVGYWSRYNYGVIAEYSRKDSTVKFLNADWTYCIQDPLESVYGLRFKIAKDTLFHYIDKKGKIIMRDTLVITSYSRNTLTLVNNDSICIVWKRRLKNSNKNVK